jgi:ferredoxin
MEDVYLRLAKHLESLIMGYPFSDSLVDLLKEMFSPLEAQVALAIPNNLAPLEVVNAEAIAARSDVPKPAITEALDSLADRHVIYSAKTSEGVQGYGLLQVGYGIPQTFFWGGQKDDRAKRMAKLILNYFTVPTTGRIYGGVSTKSYKYSPATLQVKVPMQGVLSCEQMGTIIEGTSKIAVAHCPCRMAAKLLGKTDCHHSVEVCLKYDELADFVTSRGLAREISKDEALHILGRSEKEGLVHMVDNAQGEIKHTCNCCGHYCWNVGIIRRKKIPRDVLMAVYFIRQTEPEACVGCGACAEICPVDAVRMEGDRAVVDTDWCIGCGVCAGVCPADAISIVRRSESSAPESVKALHQRIGAERLIRAGGNPCD